MGAELEKSRSEVSTGERVASRVRGHTMLAFREAARELFGEQGLTRIGSRLPTSMLTRIDQRSEWVPAEFVVAWAEAAWDCLLAHDEVALARYIDRMIDLGFGRVRRLLLAIATPQGVVRRATELWRGELTDGRLVSYGTSPTSARMVLHDHPFLESALLRAIVAEAFRYSLALAGAKDAVAHHEGELGGPLVVSLSWSG